MRQILNTLFVMTQGSYLHLERETLKLDVEKQTKLRVPMHHIGGIVLFGNVMVSPFALHRCAEDGRSVVMLTEQGRFKARLEGPQSGNVLLRRAQHQLLDDQTRSLKLIRSILAGKLQNCRAALLRGARGAATEGNAVRLKSVAGSLAASLRALPKAKDKRCGCIARHRRTGCARVFRCIQCTVADESGCIRNEWAQSPSTKGQNQCVALIPVCLVDQ